MLHYFSDILHRFTNWNHQDSTVFFVPPKVAILLPASTIIVFPHSPPICTSSLFTLSSHTSAQGPDHRRRGGGDGERESSEYLLRRGGGDGDRESSEYLRRGGGDGERESSEYLLRRGGNEGERGLSEYCL